MIDDLQRRVLLVEDEDLLRSLVGAELERRGFRVASAGSAAAAIELAASFDPDALVMDVDLGRGPTGFDVATVIAERSPGIGVVFLTNLAAPEVAQVRPRDLPPGWAFLRKTAVHDPDTIIAALNAVLDDHGSRVAFRHDLSRRDPLTGLSHSQVEMLALIAGGLTNQQIAERRGSSLRAVERLINRTFTALNLDDKTGNARVMATRAYLEARGRA